MKDPESKNNKLDILIVDDEPSVGEYLKDLLEQDGYSVMIITRGEEAVEFIRQNSTGLILLDILLPDIGGIEVLKRVRKFDRNLIVFIITAYEYSVDEIEKYTLDIYAQIEKPVNGNELKRYIRQALGK